MNINKVFLFHDKNLQDIFIFITEMEVELLLMIRNMVVKAKMLLKIQGREVTNFDSQIEC